MILLFFLPVLQPLRNHIRHYPLPLISFSRTHSIIPIDEMARSLNLFHEWFEVYPLLIFPIAVFDHGPAHEGFLRNPTNKVKGKSFEMFFDLGVYGGE